MRAFMLYHWSPVARRKSIIRDGLCPRSVSRVKGWRAEYVCFCRFPNTAWALSATHTREAGDWDLWCMWSDVAAPYETCSGARNPKVSWWMTEYRCPHRIPKSKIWHVGTKCFVPKASKGKCREV